MSTDAEQHSPANNAHPTTPDLDLEAAYRASNEPPPSTQPFYGTIPVATTSPAAAAVEEEEDVVGQQRSGSPDPFPTWVSATFALIVLVAFAWFIYAGIAIDSRR